MNTATDIGAAEIFSACRNIDQTKAATGPTTTRVSHDEFFAIARTKGSPSVRMFQLPNGGDDKYSVTRDSAGKVIDLVHDFPASF